MIHGEIIATGAELISGRVADFNARYAARRLHEAGITVARITILGDEPPLFRELLLRALARSRFIVITGGLGATEDDLTVAAAAEALGLPLHYDEALLARLRHFLAERRIPWLERHGRLALLPEGAVVLDPGGLACGFALKHDGVRLFFLPGVPTEMRALFDGYVLPSLMELAGDAGVVAQRTLRLFGISETQLQEVVAQIPEFREGVNVGYYPNFPENHLTLTVHGQDRQELAKTLDRLTAALAREVNDLLLGPEETPLEELVGRQLQEDGLTLALAESCTGGLIGHRLTSVAGSSDYFLGGVVSYGNEAKVDLLQVDPEVLTQFGAVSPETARDMALGARGMFGADLGLAVTGIAGPGGGSPEKPVGTVYIALATPDEVEVWHYLFHGNREAIKILSAETALDRLRRKLKKTVASSQ
ncbi:MAG: competence/damage-inducible protein A [Deltaproteobacteria bacterium]|nr:competence/damage-inducible protein A [Deltaproteobacteria bacterium]